VLWRLNTWVNSTLTTVNTSLCTLQAQGPCRPTPPSHPRTHTHYMNPRHRDAGCVPLFEGKRSNVILPRASYPGGVGDGILHTLDSLPAPAFTGLRSPGPTLVAEAVAGTRRLRPEQGRSTQPLPAHRLRRHSHTSRRSPLRMAVSTACRRTKCTRRSFVPSQPLLATPSGLQRCNTTNLGWTARRVYHARRAQDQRR